MMASFPNKGKKRSVSNGLSAVALGSILSTGGVAAGTQVAATAASQLKLLGETEPEDQMVWDDTEEQNYRRWLRQMQDERSAQTELDWSELDSEAAYRERLRRETEANADIPIRWDDEQERILRDKYVQMRKKQGRDQPASWDEQKAEADHREKIRQRQEANRKKPVVWDDADERKCQERYRKKYSSCN